MNFKPMQEEEKPVPEGFIARIAKIESEAVEIAGISLICKSREYGCRCHRCSGIKLGRPKNPENRVEFPELLPQKEE